MLGIYRKESYLFLSAVQLSAFQIFLELRARGEYVDGAHLNKERIPN